MGKSNPKKSFYRLPLISPYAVISQIYYLDWKPLVFAEEEPLCI